MLGVFGVFGCYDDEGLFLLAAQYLRADATFYRDVFWVYGPAQLVWTTLIHDWLGVPLNHVGVRYLTLGLWLGLAGVAAWLVLILSRSWMWALSAGALVFGYSLSVINEPGHPQLLLATLVMAAPLLVIADDSSRLLCCVLGGPWPGKQS